MVNSVVWPYILSGPGSCMSVTPSGVILVYCIYAYVLPGIDTMKVWVLTESHVCSEILSDCMHLGIYAWTTFVVTVNITKENIPPTSYFPRKVSLADTNFICIPHTQNSCSDCSVKFVFRTSIRDENGAVFRNDESTCLKYPQVSLINFNQTTSNKVDGGTMKWHIKIEVCNINL